MVYEDPWLAGGHNGLSNSENPKEPESPFPRVLELRRLMRAAQHTHNSTGQRQTQSACATRGVV